MSRPTDGPAQRRLVLVDMRVLPDIVQRTLQAKRLLQTGQASSVTQATRAVGLSRTAFYKYRDAVIPYDEEKAGRVITVQIRMAHQPGVISRVLDSFAAEGANILTVHQNIPSGGVAHAVISARVDRLSVPVREFLQSLQALDGVKRVTLDKG